MSSSVWFGTGAQRCKDNEMRKPKNKNYRFKLLISITFNIVLFVLLRVFSQPFGNLDGILSSCNTREVYTEVPEVQGVRPL